jgi:simple sugar transport system permease protein
VTTADATAPTSRLENLRRSAAVTGPEYAWPAAALVASLAIVAPLVALAGEAPLEGYSKLFEASFADPAGFGVMLQYSVPLILVGLGVALPLRVGLFNIGGEGQLVVGALAAVVIGVHFGAVAGVPGSFVVPLLAAGLAGALLGAVAGALKAWRGINEIITTIMLNFIGLLFVQYWVTGPFKDPKLTYAASPMINRDFAIDRLAGDAGIPSSFFVAVVIAIAVGAAVHYSKVGWRLHLGGLNPELADRQGARVPLLYFGALAAGGALAGVGGGAEALGNQLRVGEEFSPGWGFDAVAIAILARGNMLAVVPYALFFGFLRNGAGVLQTDLGVPGAIVVMLAGAPVIIVASVIGFRAYRRARRA